MFAVITQFTTGLLTWPMAGLALGYGVALFARGEGAILLVPTLLGLIGGLLGGLAAGSMMSGHGLWESNIAALVGAGVLSIGWLAVAQPKAARPG